MRQIHTVVVHHSDSGPSTTVAQINQWHRDRGFRRSSGWRDLARRELDAIGYHAVIDTNGRLHHGRHLGELGAHAQGANTGTVGVCLVGRTEFTEAQFVALATFVKHVELAAGRTVRVRGHKDVGTTATVCPSFDVDAWAAEYRTIAGRA